MELCCRALGRVIFGKTLAQQDSLAQQIASLRIQVRPPGRDCLGSSSPNHRTCRLIRQGFLCCTALQFSTDLARYLPT